MSLPSGYKRLEYIRATGTQYLDLGVTMEKTDSITLEATMTLDAPSDTRYFGANGYMQIAVTSGGYSINGSAMKPLGKQDIVKCVFASVTESLYINNVLAESKSWSSYNASNTKIGLFKMGDPSNGWYSGAALSGNLYGGTLIKNGVTVCNFIPCKNASGVAGVWDDAAGVFRGSAGTSNFVAGPELIGDNRVLVDAKGYDAKTWTVLIGGMGYHIQKGRGLIDGMGYDIPFSAAPAVGTQWIIDQVGSGVWSCPATGTYEVELHGGGGGGGGVIASSTGDAKYGGGGSGSGELYTMQLNEGDIAYTVGAGGTGGLSNTNGGASSFGGKSINGGNAGSDYYVMAGVGSLAGSGPAGGNTYRVSGGLGNVNKPSQSYGNGGGSTYSGNNGGIIITYKGT